MPNHKKCAQSHIPESQFDHIPNTQSKHSNCQSFSNISATSLAKVTIHPKASLVLGPSVSYKPSHLDFRSISEYSFTQSSVCHHSKADVCSLPICIDDEMNSKMLENTKSHFNDSQRRMPSYVSISRAISGYSDYNKYCSDLKRDNSLLDTFLTSTISSSPNGDHAQLAKQRQWHLVDDQVDNFYSLPYEPTQEKICLSDPSKSFLQKKIESLYGQTFAEDWQKSRLKGNTCKQNTPGEKTRSPSCPPSRIVSSDVNRLATPFQKINSLDNPKGIKMKIYLKYF